MKYADGTAERNPCKFYPSKKQVKMYQSKRHTKSRSGFINNDRIFLLSLLLYYPYFTFANQKHTQAKYPLIISICCVISVNHTKEYLYIFEISSAYFFFLSFSFGWCACVRVSVIVWQQISISLLMMQSFFAKQESQMYFLILATLRCIESLCMCEWNIHTYIYKYIGKTNTYINKHT